MVNQVHNLEKLKISVVCPVYNAEKFILKTLESVFRQTFLPYEMIISDDGSTDKTVVLIEDYLRKKSINLSISFLKNIHGGPGAARNKGLEKTSGDWIAFLDADDLWLPHKLKTVSEYIKKYPEKNFFCHDEEYRRLDGRREVWQYGLKYNEEKPLPPQLFSKTFFSTSAVVCPKTIIEKVGGFNERLPSAQDYELWLRMSPYIKPFFIRKVLGCYLEVEGSISSMPYWRKYWHRMKIAFRHRDKSTAITFTMKIVRLTFSKSWLSSFKNLFSSKSVHN